MAIVRNLGDPADAPDEHNSTIDTDEYYLPEFSGGGPRTVREKLAEFISVTDFGAVGDGVTNDRPAIQAAIDYVHGQGGGVVYMPAGTYLVSASAYSSAVYIKAGVWLKGAQRKATIIRLANGANTSTVGFEQDESDMALSDLTIDGNRDNQTLDVHGVRFYGNGRTYVGRLIVRDCRRYGLGVAYNATTQIPWHDSLVEDCEIYNIGNLAVGDGFDGKRSEHCTIRRMYVHDCIANGMDIRGNHTSISDCYIADCGQVGFSQRMSAYDPPDAGVSLRESRHLYASNITVENCGSHGFWVEAVEGVPWSTIDWMGRAFMVNCIARGNTGRGFYLEGGEGRCYYHLANCLAENNLSHGFQLNASNLADIRGKLVNCTAIGNGVQGFDVSATLGDGDILVACEAANNVIGFNVAGSRHSLIGCRASGNSSDGIRLGGDDCVVAGGSIVTATAIGVRINAGDHNIVTALSIDTVSGTGINVIAASVGNRLTGNNLSAVGGTKIVDSGTDTRFHDNIGSDKPTVIYPGAASYANDAAAAAGGIPLNGLYHTSGALKVRLV